MFVVGREKFRREDRVLNKSNGYSTKKIINENDQSLNLLQSVRNYICHAYCGRDENMCK